MTGRQRDFEDNTTFGERLTQAIKSSGLTNAEVAEQLGYKSSSTLYRATRGAGALDLSVLKKLGALSLGEMKINLHWLITGVGSMRLEDKNTETSDELLTRIASLNPRQRTALNQLLATFDKTQTEKREKAKRPQKSN